MIIARGHDPPAVLTNSNTPEYPDGTYAYFLTEDWPVIPRAFRGTLARLRQRGPPPAPPPMTFLKIANAVASGTLMTWVLVAPICWMLRDGLGPGMKSSTGWEAVLRFLTSFHWGFVFVMLVIAVGFTAGLRKAREPKID